MPVPIPPGIVRAQSRPGARASIRSTGLLKGILFVGLSAAQRWLRIESVWVVVRRFSYPR